MLKSISVHFMLLLPIILGRPQEQNIEDIVATIFTSPRPSQATPRRGFDQVVTAEPIVNPSSQTEIIDAETTSCKCVEYFLCNPMNNTVIGEVDSFGRIDINSDAKVCEDILDVCCGGTKIQEKPIPIRKVTQIPNRAEGCGVRNPGGIDFELIGNLNNEAGFGEFSWQAALISTLDQKYLCGGSLIHPKVVLTANHCVRKLKPRQLKIRVGEWDTQTVKERLPYQERNVISIVNHPQYDIETVSNDYPTSEPQFFEDDAGAQCKCVPYDLCNPTNNSRINEVDGFGLLDIRFDADSCQDVLDVCCNEQKIQDKPLTVRPVNEIPNRAQGCGIRNVGGLDFQIIGDVNNEAGFGEFPWTIALIKIPEEKCICGGSLIHPQVVLTGNHCVRKLAPRNVKCRAGEWDTQTIKERLPYQERIASRIISHPDFLTKDLANNYALVVLEQPFTLADHINVVCLPPQNYLSSSQNCYATGWGKDLFGKQGKYSVIMKRVNLPIVSSDQCENELRNTRLGPTFQLHPTFICAGGRKNQDTCEGDGGAPLVCPVGPSSQNRYSQSGIVSWGIGCNEERPAVYANVALVRNWIDTQIRSMGYDPQVYTY